MEKDKFEIVLKQANLDEDRQQLIRSKFAEYIQFSEMMVQQEAELVIKDENDLAAMERAKQAAKDLTTMEGKIEALRVAIKSQPLSECQAIDTVSRMLKGLISPIKEKYKVKADYRKNWLIEQRQLLRQKRREILTGLDYDTTIDLAEMTDVNFSFFVIRLQEEKAEKVKKQEEALELKRKQDAEAEENRKKDAEEKKRMQDEINRLNEEKSKLENQLEQVKSPLDATEVSNDLIHMEPLKKEFYTPIPKDPVILTPAIPPGGDNKMSDLYKARAFAARLNQLYVPTDITDQKLQELVNIAATSLTRYSEIITKYLDEDGR